MRWNEDVIRNYAAVGLQAAEEYLAQRAAVDGVDQTNVAVLWDADADDEEATYKATYDLPTVVPVPTDVYALDRAGEAGAVAGWLSDHYGFYVVDWRALNLGS